MNKHSEWLRSRGTETPEYVSYMQAAADYIDKLEQELYLVNICREDVAYGDSSPCGVCSDCWKCENAKLIKERDVEIKLKVAAQSEIIRLRKMIEDALAQWNNHGELVAGEMVGILREALKDDS